MHCKGSLEEGGLLLHRPKASHLSRLLKDWESKSQEDIKEAGITGQESSQCKGPEAGSE